MCAFFSLCVNLWVLLGVVVTYSDDKFLDLGVDRAVRHDSSKINLSDRAFLRSPLCADHILVVPHRSHLAAACQDSRAAPHPSACEPAPLA